MTLIKHTLFLALALAACSSNGSNSPGAGSAGNTASSGSSGAPSSAAGAAVSAGGSPTTSEGGSGDGVAGGTSSGGAGANPTAGGAGMSGMSGSGGHAGAGAGAGAGGRADGGAGGGSGGSAGSAGASAHGGASGGCGKPVMRPSLTAQQQMDVGGGTMRTYLLDVPQSVDNQTPLALIFALHGANMTNTQVVGSFNLGSLSKGKAIAVYPQGDQTASGARWTSNEANWSYLQMLMTDLESRYCIDPNRVFLTGFSMGGGFTMDTACQKSTMFRAFATVEGYGPGGVMAATQPTCSNANAKAPLLIIQGSTDGTVTPAMGQASLAFWTGKNGCSATTAMPMGAGFTSCTANEDCTSGFPVYYCTGTWMHAITSTAAADVWAFFSTFN